MYRKYHKKALKDIDKLKKNNNSSKYYYICKRHNLALKCSCNTNFNENKIEKKLLEQFNAQLKHYISDYEYKQKKIEKLDLSKEISTLENKLIRLKDLYVRDLIRIDDYEKDYKNYISQLDIFYKKQNEMKHDQPKNIDNIDALKSLLSQDFNSIYNSLSREEKRRLWLSIIDYIVLDKDYTMKIFFI